MERIASDGKKGRTDEKNTGYGRHDLCKQIRG